MQPVNASLAALVANDFRHPIGKVTVYQTNKSVPSKGFNFSAYGLANDTDMNQADWWSGLSADTPVDSVSDGTFLTGSNIIEPSTVMAHDFGVGGVPAPVTGRSDLWAVRWYGYFFARYGGSYRFYIDSSPHARVRMAIDGVYFGDNYAQNGGFDTDTLWTKGAGWTISDGKAVAAAGAGSDLVQSTEELTDLKSFLVEYTVSGRTAGTVTAKAGTTAGTARSTNDTFREVIVCGGDEFLRFTKDAAFDGDIDVVCVNGFTDSNTISVDRWNGDDVAFARTAKELYFDTPTLVQGTWYDIAIEFWMPKYLDPQNMPTYVCVKYREPDDTTNLNLWDESGGDIVTDYQSDYQDEDGNDIKKVLSAGVVNTTNTFLTGEEVFGVESISGSRQSGEVSEYQFVINIPASTNLNGALAGGEQTITVDSTAGFPEAGALNIEGDHITYTGKDVNGTDFTGVPAAGVGATGAHDDNVLISQFIGEDQTDMIYGYDPLTNSIGAMRAFRLVQIEGGLNDGASTDYYADRIWGHIYPGPVVDRGNKKATIKVRDFGRMLVGQYNRNYPDNISYSMADYYDHYRENVPDGISRPPCYDRWDVARAARDILIRANIDPILLYQRDRHRVTGAYAADYGQYLIRGGHYLDSKPHYGQPRHIEESGADDKYIWTFGYGTSLWENLMEIVKNYSFRFGFTPSGFARVQPFGWPDEELWCDDTGGGLTFIGTDWNDDVDNLNDFDVFKARYRKSNGVGDKVTLTQLITGDNSTMDTQGDWVNFGGGGVTGGFDSGDGAPYDKTLRVEASSVSFDGAKLIISGLTFVPGAKSFLVVSYKHINTTDISFPYTMITVRDSIGGAIATKTVAAAAGSFTTVMLEWTATGDETDVILMANYADGHADNEVLFDEFFIVSPPYWNDAEIILQRHDGAAQKIKVKIGESYVSSLIIDGALVSGAGGGSDEFAIAARGAGLTWSYYDGVDSALGVNPCIIQLADGETFSSQLIEVEVVDGEIRFNAIFLYKRSTRTSSKSIGNDEMGTLRLEQDIENQRNEIDVIGAEQGLFENIGGNVINPNNPIYVHTISRALDLDSVYNENADNYIGTAIPIEIYDERINDQERADYVAVYALDRYRLNPTKGSANFLFDPTLEPIDVLAITDEHTRMLDNTNCWILGISESLVKKPDGSVSYTTTINSVDPRSPMPSMRTKPIPDIADWDDEPLVNIEIHYRGFRVAGSDAAYTAATKTILIGTSPGWDTNMWAGYRVSDQDDHKVGSIHGYEILSNDADELVLVDPPAEGFTAGNWCIIFDPLDSEGIGAPLEIHYDQVVNAKIEVFIADNKMKRIADLNVDMRELIQYWGPGKRIYWSGIIHYGFKELKGDFYASPYTLDDYANRMPFIVVFIISYETNTGTKVVTMKSHVTGADLVTPSDYVQLNSADTDHSPRGAAKLIAQTNDPGCYLEPTVSATGDGTVLNAGRLYKYTVLNGNIKLYVEDNLFTAHVYNGDYIVCGRSGVWMRITDTGNDGTDGWVTVLTTETELELAGFTGHWNLDHADLTKQADEGNWPWIKIVEMPHPIHFRETDNSDEGLVISFDLADFYVEGLHPELFKVGFEVVAVGVRAKNKTTCEEELTVNYKGTQYTIAAGSDVKHAQLGDISNEGSYTASDLWPLRSSFGHQIFWSINDPTHLHFSMGLNPDTKNPIEGLYVIGEIKANIALRFHITCATTSSRVKSLVTIPTIEIHQLTSIVDVGIDAWRFSPLQAEEIKLQGYGIFQSPRDISIALSPKSIQQSTTGDPLYFMQSLRDGTIPEKTLWLFLIKMEVYDRLGRPPLNMGGTKPLELLSDDEVPLQSVSESDYYGIPALWDPGSGYNIVSCGLWEFAREYHSKINSARAISLVVWEVT